MTQWFLRMSTALFALACLSPLAKAQELPSDLARVPGHAIGFAHVKVADFLKTTSGKSALALLQKAGPAALEIMEERIVPSLLSIERVTVIVLPGDRGNPEFAVLLATKTPFDAEKVVEKMVKQMEGGQTWYVDQRNQISVQPINNKTLLIGSPKSVLALANGPKVAAGMAEALELAASGKKSVVVGLNPSLIPPNAFDHAPPPLQPYIPAFKAKSIYAYMDFQENPEVNVAARYADAAAAGDAEKALLQAKEFGRQMLGQARDFAKKKLFQGDGKVSLLQGEALMEIVGPIFLMGMIERGKELLDEIPLKRNSDTLTMKVKVPEELSAYGASSGPILIALLLPAVQKVREAATRTQDMNHFKQLALAMHNYADINTRFPPAAICNKQGKPLLSWRVAILPFIEQEQLYRQFKLDEPWDSEHNKKLLPRMPQLYLVPGSPADATETHYQVIVGPENGQHATIFPGYRMSSKFVDITDGTSNTILIGAAARAVPWTKPEDMKFDPEGALPRFYMGFGNGSNVAFADGSVRFISATIAENVLRALLTRGGGEVIAPD